MIYFEDLQIGDGYGIQSIFTQANVNVFSDLSGDDTPIHWDKEYAAKTFFKKPIVHGVLVVSKLSTVIGKHFPGPGSIAESMEINFIAPLYPLQEFTANVKVVNLNPKTKEILLACNVTTSEDVVIVEGEAVVTMPRRPK